MRVPLIFIETTDVYGCDSDGMSLLKSTQYADVTTTDQGRSQDTTVTTYDAPYLVLPLDFHLGDTWEATAKGTTEDSSTGATHPFDYTTTAKVADDDNLSVAAGDYSTLRVDVEAAGATLQSWYAEDVGLVAAEDRELKSYSP